VNPKALSRSRALVSATLGLVVVSVLAGCSTPAAMPAPTPTATVAPTGDGVLRVGTIVPASGTYAFLGPAQAAGVQLAVREINDAGGVGGVPVELLQRDEGDAGTRKAEESLADLVAQKADVIVGPSSSVIAERLMPLVVSAKIPMISPAATFTSLTDANDSGYFFRTIPSYATQGDALGKALSEKGPVKVGLVYITDELGQSVADTLGESLDANGSELVASQGLPVASTDFDPAIAKIVEAKPDAVVLASSYSSFDTTKALITKLLAAGFGGAKLWLTTQNTGDYNQAFAPGTLAGVNGIIEGVVADEAFQARLKQVDSGLAATRYSVESYDATILAALAAIVAGDDGGPAIAAALEDVSKGGIKCTTFAECLEVLKTQHDIDYDGVSGPVNFTPQGDVLPVWYGLYSYDGDNKFVFAHGVIAG
jgi:ABC-type branched-subunit amino acid transport system substrate-binding protein